MSEITTSEQIRLDIIKKVNYDTAAAKLAIDWVGYSLTLSIASSLKVRLSRRPVKRFRKRPKRWRCLIPQLSRPAKALQLVPMEVLFSFRKGGID